nr:2425_t:CDS:2 [Entrophospora candida]CAG8548827.1 13665_t:CDS:2 [Entrophospora candida]
MCTQQKQPSTAYSHNHQYETSPDSCRHNNNTAYVTIGSESETFAQNSYERRLSWSPAASFLKNLDSKPVKLPSIPDEGQQVGKYVLGRIIGRGGFSTVREGYTIDNYSDSMEKASLEREILIWRKLNHSNIVSIISVEKTVFATFIFSEYCSGGTLLQYLMKKYSFLSFDVYKDVEKEIVKGLDEDEARNIFLEVVNAVRYLHNDMGLVHKDIKLDNILLGRNNTWKLCDFGLTEFQNPHVNGFDNIVFDDIVCGSLTYSSPEQIKSKKPLKIPTVDIWSLGVVIFALVTSQLPFLDKFEPRLQYKILNGRYDESLLQRAGVSNEFHDLLKGMFKTKPDQRLTINQIIDHPWCRNQRD